MKKKEETQGYSSVEELFGKIAEVKPISKDYVCPITGCRMRIEGVPFQRKIEIERAAGEIHKRTESGALPVKARTGELFKPEYSQVLIATYAAACVTAPKISELDWLAVNYQVGLLYELWPQIRVCNLELTEDGKTAQAVAEETLEQSPLSPTL